MHGHFAAGLVLKRAIRKYYWPTRVHDIHYYCHSCHACQLVGPLRPSVDQQKSIFLLTDRAGFRTNSVRSLHPVLPVVPCLRCLSFLASSAPERPTFPPQGPTRLLCPHPLRVPPTCIRPLILSSSGLLPTPCSCTRPATISATVSCLAT